MNFHNINPDYPSRRVEGYQHVSITDDFGNTMFVGDLVQIHVMPYDYVVQGRLDFDTDECKFFVECFPGNYSLSHYDEWQDMSATNEITKTFKYIQEDNK